MDQSELHAPANPLVEELGEISPDSFNHFTSKGRRQFGLKDENVQTLDKQLKHKNNLWNNWKSNFVPEFKVKRIKIQIVTCFIKYA